MADGNGRCHPTPMMYTTSTGGPSMENLNSGHKEALLADLNFLYMSEGIKGVSSNLNSSHWSIQWSVRGNAKISMYISEHFLTLSHDHVTKVIMQHNTHLCSHSHDIKS